MTDCTSQGWGVVDKGGKLNLNTVSATRRAAIVNWLVGERHTMIYGDTTDAEIEDRWIFYREAADVVRVNVMVADGERADDKTQWPRRQEEARAADPRAAEDIIREGRDAWSKST